MKFQAVKHGPSCKTYTGSCGCNEHGNGIQCKGFANIIGDLAYGSVPHSARSRDKGWPVTLEYDHNTLIAKLVHLIKPGAYIRFMTNINDDETQEHSAIVQEVFENGVTLLECNMDMDEPCIIRRDSFFWEELKPYTYSKWDCGFIKNSP